nr:MAG TPA: hypothetical protein [Caudoviricetes sp.]
MVTMRNKLKRLKSLIEMYISKETIVAMFMTIVFIILIIAIVEEDMKMAIEVLKVFSAVLGIIFNNVI